MPREQKRVPFVFEAELELPVGRAQGSVTDLSVGGCYVKSLAPVRLGETVAFDLPASSGSRKPVHIVGTVARVYEGGGFGLSFNALSQEDTMQLLHLMRDRGL